jgi:RNA polymerase primary sigma factor
MMEFYNKVARASMELIQQLGREPKEEIAERLGLPTSRRFYRLMQGFE